MINSRLRTTVLVCFLALVVGELSAQRTRSMIAVDPSAASLTLPTFQSVEAQRNVSSELESRLRVSPVLTGSRLPKLVDAVQAELPGIQVGFTYYDFQTNGSMPNRLVYTAEGPDRYVQMVWMVSKDSSRDVTTRIPGFAGDFRGTHYTFFDVTNPDQPQIGIEKWEKIEEKRAGWPSIVQYKKGSVGIASHTPIGFYSNQGVGDMPVMTTEVTTAADLSQWPRTAVDEDGNTHLLFNRNQGTETNPVNQVGYRRSTDGGFTWSDEVLFTGASAPEPNQPGGLGGDTYAITARGKKVVIGYTDGSLRLVTRTSTDGGATWPSDLARLTFSPQYTNIDSSENQWGTFEVRTDTVPTPNGHLDVIIDSEGTTHLVVGVVPAYVVRKDTNGTRQGTIFVVNDRQALRTAGMGYIKEGTNNIFFMAPPAGGEWDGKGYPMNLRFFDNASRWPQLGLDAQNNLYCTYGSWKNGDTKNILADTTGGNQQNEPDTTAPVDALNGHIWVTYLKAGTTTWSAPYNMTPDGVNCQYASLCDDVVNDRLYIGYSASPTPGDHVTNLELPAESTKVMMVAFDKNLLPVSVDEELPLDADVTIAPNPAQGASTVRIVSNTDGVITVTLMSSVGERVLRSSSPSTVGSWDVTIPTDGLAAGMYHVVVEQSGRRTVRPLSVVR